MPTGKSQATYEFAYLTRPDEDLVLGSGRRLFADGGPLATLGLVDSMTTTPANLSWMLWTAIGISGIWIAVLLLSLLARNLTSGSQQDTSHRRAHHLPVMVTGTGPDTDPFAAIFAPIAAAMLTALTGAVATAFRGGPEAGSSAEVVASTAGSMPAGTVVASLHHPDSPGPGRAGRGRSIQ